MANREIIGNNSSPGLTSLNPEEINILKKSIQEYDDSLTRGKAERDLQKEVAEDVMKQVNISKKLFKKLAKARHNRDFDIEATENQDFEAAYETLFK